jgi:hypothetical protein
VSVPALHVATTLHRSLPTLRLLIIIFLQDKLNKKTGEAEISATGTPGALCSRCKEKIINKIEQGAVPE